MANGCRYTHHHQENLYKHNTFLPLLCRASTRDVRLRNHRDRSSSSIPKDPSSPKVSCIGQVKKTTAGNTSNAVKYTKLKRMFSGKSVPTTPFPSTRFSRDLDIGELDPPLPVTGKAPPPPSDLWKRRSGGGVALSKLQIHAPANNYHPPASIL